MPSVRRSWKQKTRNLVALAPRRGAREILRRLRRAPPETKSEGGLPGLRQAPAPACARPVDNPQAVAGLPDPVARGPGAAGSGLQRRAGGGGLAGHQDRRTDIRAPDVAGTLDAGSLPPGAGDGTAQGADEVTKKPPVMRPGASVFKPERHAPYRRRG